MILDGRKCAESFKARLKILQERSPQVRQPRLCLIQIGEEPSNVIARLIKKDCADVDFECEVHHFDDNLPDLVQRVRTLIREKNEDGAIDGIAVLLPITGWLSGETYLVQSIMNTIAEAKDVAGLGLRPVNPWNHFRYQGHNAITAYGILSLLNYYKIPIEGRRAVVVGKNDYITLPIIEMLIHYGATITSCNVQTPFRTLTDELYKADIIVLATGKGNFIDESSLGRLDPGNPVVIIDLGNEISEFNDDMLQHDANGLELASWTPVPGGVGPMTRVGLLLNTHDAYRYALRKAGVYRG